MHVRIGILSLVLGSILGQAATARPVEYLSDRLDLVVASHQGWGVLGINRAAHARDQSAWPLKIGGKQYAKGLGSHAPGEIVVDLGGRYARFEAEVGVQVPQAGGSVIFQVFVDDKQVFDSGVMKVDEPAKAVSVPVVGAQELRLVATEAGDGMNCDAANWAGARLLRDLSAKPAPSAAETFDVARFARVVTSDPAVMHGARSTRVQEFEADDLYLDTDVYPDDQGRYVLSGAAGERVAIGLRWVERRHPRSLAIEFAAAPRPEQVEATEVQYWTGESPVQGQWRTLNGTLIAPGDRWTFRVDSRQNPDLRNGTWKIRWVMPVADESLVVRRLRASTASIIKTVDLALQFGSSGSTGQIELEMYSGEFVEPAAFAGQTRARVDAAESIPLKIRYIERRSWQADRAVLRIRRMEGSFAIAIDDVLKNKAVYVPSNQAMLSLADANLTIADYRRQIAEKETILQEVRRLPDQTLAQVTKAIHRKSQNVQPTMLSLACDNNKFIVHRDGHVAFSVPADPNKPTPPNTGVYPSLVRAICGSGKNEKIERHLDGGWYPISVVAIDDGGMRYRQTAFVVPSDGQAAVENPWLNPKPLFVASYVIENTGSTPADASLRLEFVGHAKENVPAVVTIAGGRANAAYEGRLLGSVDVGEGDLLKASAQGGALMLTGRLKAGQTATCDLYLPGWKMGAEQASSLIGGLKRVPECKAYWDRVLSGAMQVEVPDSLLGNLIKASQVHCLMASRNEADGKLVAPWIASVAYGPLESEAHSIVRGMSFFGHDEFSRRSLDYFISKYDPSGMLTTGYTLMGGGWHLWTLGEHYRVARDADWLKSVASKVATACNWVMKQREKTRRPDARGKLLPEAGLMPPGVMADWDVFAYYMYLNGYYCAGLRDAGEALVDVGAPGADAFVKDAEAFRGDILRAFRATQAVSPVLGLRNGTFVPPYPTQLLPGPTGQFFPGADGNRSWCYDVELGAHHLVPFGILAPDAKDVEWMMDHMEDVQFLSDGWFDYSAVENAKDPFNFGGFAKVQPYYARNAEVCAMRDDVKPFVRTYFNTIPSLVSLENLCFMEHFNGAGAWNKTHETGYFLHQTRIMLVMERGEELWLAPLITNNWLKDGSAVAVKNAPTFFGPVSYRIESHAGAGAIDATIEPPTRSAPKQIVLRLRHPEGKAIRKVAVNGKDHAAFDAAKEIIRIEPTKETILVKAEFGEAKPAER